MQILIFSIFLRHPYINSDMQLPMMAVNIWLWAIDIVIQSMNSNLEPKAFSLHEYEIAP